MFYWLLGSIGVFLLNFIYGMFYILQTQLLVKSTLGHPLVNGEIGSPRSIMDISKRHNCECYEAFRKFNDNKRYLDLDIPKTLADRFVRLERTRKTGIKFTVITITNFAVCLSALLFLSDCKLS